MKPRIYASISRIRAIPLKVIVIFKKVQIFTNLKVKDNSNYLIIIVLLAFQMVFNYLELFQFL